MFKIFFFLATLAMVYGRPSHHLGLAHHLELAPTAYHSLIGQQTTINHHSSSVIHPPQVRAIYPTISNYEAPLVNARFIGAPAPVVSTRISGWPYTSWTNGRFGSWAI